MNHYDLTQQESTALINALINVSEELRVRWLALADIDQFTADDRSITNAWLALNEKPFGSRAFERGLDTITGKNALYPEAVDVDALKSALIKINGGGQ